MKERKNTVGHKSRLVVLIPAIVSVPLIVLVNSFFSLFGVEKMREKK